MVTTAIHVVTVSDATVTTHTGLAGHGAKGLKKKQSQVPVHPNTHLIVPSVSASYAICKVTEWIPTLEITMHSTSFGMLPLERNQELGALLQRHSVAHVPVPHHLNNA